MAPILPPRREFPSGGTPDVETFTGHFPDWRLRDLRLGPSTRNSPTKTHSTKERHHAAADLCQSVSSRVVWAAGTGGTYVVTTDGGETWKAAVVPGAENLQFRDVQGVSDQVAYLMSIGGNTTDFRIYKTV